jgi:hypothetical protein
MKMGLGGADSCVDGFGLPISAIRLLMSLSVVDIESHFMKSWSIWPFAT